MNMILKKSSQSLFENITYSTEIGSALERDIPQGDNENGLQTVILMSKLPQSVNLFLISGG
jgi:hypothetical protein